MLPFHSEHFHCIFSTLLLEFIQQLHRVSKNCYYNVIFLSDLGFFKDSEIDGLSKSIVVVIRNLEEEG